MGKKPPDHVHCARCGYRGINAQHDCNDVRAATAAVIAQAARRDEAQRIAGERDNDAEARDRAINDVAEFVYKLSLDHSRLFGRHVRYEAESPAPATLNIFITQRCSACAADIERKVRADLSNPLEGMRLGAEARKAYMLHRCPPVDKALVGFTYEELETLRTEIDRDATNMLERVGEIQKLEAARVITGPEDSKG